MLGRRYIPNLTAVPFEVTRAYFETVYMLTESPVAGNILASWSDALLEDPAEKAHLAAALLIELLAYQLASPVQWIKTQDYLFGAASVERVVEIGPSPVLCGMAAKTLQSARPEDRQVSLLHFERDQDEIYYRHIHEEGEAAVAQAPAVASLPETPVEQPMVEPSSPMSQSQLSTSPGAGEPITDVQLLALDIIQVIIAFKLKQPLGGISAQQTIKTLVAGKSTLQNELVGDLQKEFGTEMPGKPEDMPLRELGASIGTAGALGKCTQPLIARLFSSKMPGGFSLSSARGVLQSAYGLGPQRQDALLLVALTMEPAARLGSEADARSWLDGVAKAYASRAGISYAAAAGAATAGGQAQGPVLSSAEMDRMQKEQREHARQQIEVLARYAGIDLRADGRSAESERARNGELQTNLDSLSAELGDDFVEGIKPRFDARKVRRFDSYWNWARQGAYEWIQQTIAGGAVVEDEARILQLQNCADEKLLKLLDGSVAVLNAIADPALAAAHCLATRLREACTQALGGRPVYRELSAPMQPQTDISQTGSVNYSEVPRAGEPSFADYVEHMKCGNADSALPLLHMREKTEHGPWTYSPLLSEAYYRGLAELSGPGTSYVGATALVTGCGRGSIGAEIVRALLMGGARVLATTSSYSRSTTLFFEDIYRKHGARGSELVVVPFNQGSVQDVEALAGFVFGGLGWSLDYVFPFAAVSDVGSLVTNIGSCSELAQRVILTNVLQLLGVIKAAKERTRRATRPSLVVLPLSPNHGTIGGDGLYGECKIALETVLNRWASEGWEGHLSVAGAIIG
ncbi:fatty acid synthase alpha subunit Lsd1, partial [Coemansia biformis]